MSTNLRVCHEKSIDYITSLDNGPSWSTLSNHQARFGVQNPSEVYDKGLHKTLTSIQDNWPADLRYPSRVIRPLTCESDKRMA